MNEVTTQNIAIIGSGPAGWTAAIYAARAALEPILFEGALTPENQDAGRLPMGQLATTTYVENYPGFPAGDLREYLKTTIDEERQYALPYDTFDEVASKRGVSGPALVELMRKQALDCGVRVVSEDVAKVDFSKRPFKLVDSNGDEYFSRSVIVATGASARWLGLTSEEFFKNNGVSACAVRCCRRLRPRLRRLRRRVAAFLQTPHSCRRRRRFRSGRRALLDEVREQSVPRPPSRPTPRVKRHAKETPRKSQSRTPLESCPYGNPRFSGKGRRTRETRKRPRLRRNPVGNRSVGSLRRDWTTPQHGVFRRRAQTRCKRLHPPRIGLRDRNKRSRRLCCGRLR